MANLDDSILETIKDMILGDKEEDSFDTELIADINAADDENYTGEISAITFSCTKLYADELKIIDGVTVFDSVKGINIPPQKRHTGLMFQNYALFPNMTVYHNLRAGQRHYDAGGG